MRDPDDLYGLRIWLVVSPGGVLGAYRTRGAALAEWAKGPVVARRDYGPGMYDYRWVYDIKAVHRGGSFTLARSDVAASHGWQWALEAWERAGKPLGRYTEPLRGHVPTGA